MLRIALGIILVAAASTLGDYIWYEFGVRHRAIVGVLHGALLLMAVGGVIGNAAGRTIAGLFMGAAAGIGGALAYYALAPVAGGVAMVAAWVIVWLLLAIGEGRLLQRVRRGWPDVLARGMLAAVLSGIAFAAVLGLLWGRPPQGERSYLLQFAAWTIAWAPGLLAIVIGGRRDRAT